MDSRADDDDDLALTTMGGSSGNPEVVVRFQLVVVRVSTVKREYVLMA